MRSAHWLRGLLPKECSQTSLDSAVCRCGRADSCAMVRLFATTSAEALLPPESAQPHNWQRTEPLRNPVRPFQYAGEHPKPQSSKCGTALGESWASRNLSVHSSDQYPQKSASFLMNALLSFHRNCSKTDTRRTDGQEMNECERRALGLCRCWPRDLHPDVLWNTACK